jgi:hypothetical protein
MILLLMLLTGNVTAQVPVMSFDPDYSEVAYDSLFEVKLVVDDNSEGIKAFSVQIHIQTDFLRLDTVLEGSLLYESTGYPTFFDYNLLASENALFIDGAVLGGTTTASGGGVLAHIWFVAHIDSSVYTPLELVSITVLDSNDMELSYSTDDGEVRVCLQRGDVNNDHIIDIDDVVYIIEYIFSNGDAPIPHYLVGDVDCMDETDIDDVVYLIQYIFAGGPPPCTLCYPE